MAPVFVCIDPSSHDAGGGSVANLLCEERLDAMARATSLCHICACIYILCIYVLCIAFMHLCLRCTCLHCLHVHTVYLADLAYYGGAGQDKESMP